METSRWPHIRQYLRDQGRDDFFGWYFAAARITLPDLDVAAASEEWADFYEWRLDQRADELSGDRTKRHLVEEWTADMAYCCRRWAAWARGEHPGEWLPLSERRPDIDAEGHAIVAEIVAKRITSSSSKPALFA